MEKSEGRQTWGSRAPGAHRVWVEEEPALATGLRGPDKGPCQRKAGKERRLLIPGEQAREAARAQRTMGT